MEILTQNCIETSNLTPVTTEYIMRKKGIIKFSFTAMILKTTK